MDLSKFAEFTEPEIYGLIDTKVLRAFILLGRKDLIK